MQVVAVAPNQWDGQWMNRQHLMWAVKDLASVLYVQEPEPWYRGRKPRDERFLRLTVETKAANLSVLRLPKALCRRGREGRWNETVEVAKARLINSAAGQQSGRRLFYFWHPELHSYLDLVDHDVSVFHIYDRIPEYYKPAYAGTPVYKAFQEACQRADLIVAGTPEQAAIVPGREITILPNAVTYENYAAELPQPAEMAGIPRPRVGYSGSFSQKLDLAWFEALANDGQVHVVLIGPIGNLGEECAAEFERICAHDRVHYLGPKPAGELPAYLKALDAGLVNYRRGIHSEAASPLKLFEYAAAGLPIVAARTESMAGDAELAELVTFADSAEQAVAAVGRALRDDMDRTRQQRRIEFAKQNSWKQRACRVLELAGMPFDETVAPRPSSKQQSQTVTL